LSALVAAGRRYLPRGWGDLGRQLAIWFGFLAAYQIARGLADRNPPRAFQNGLHVIGIERHTHALIELTLQRAVDGSQFLADLAAWTYWNSEFTVVGLALLWSACGATGVVRFRNTICLGDRAGRLRAPTAPPRIRLRRRHLATGGLATAAAPTTSRRAVRGDAEPHAADALIVGLVLFSVCRNRFVKVFCSLACGLVQRDGHQQPLPLDVWPGSSSRRSRSRSSTAFRVGRPPPPGDGLRRLAQHQRPRP
jgi:hypothetical protein